jgi:mannose-6-phosphate isomerase-like protein (cupin superfamily)
MTTTDTKNLVLTLKDEIENRVGFEKRGSGDDIIAGYMSKTLFKEKLWVLIADIEPSMKKAAHAHPDSDSILIILEGEGEYFMGDEHTTRHVKVGDVCIAPAGELHGVYNTGTVNVRYMAIEGPTPVTFAAREKSWNV